MLQAWAMSVVLWGGLILLFGIEVIPFLMLQAVLGAGLLEINGAFFYGIRDQVKSTNWRTDTNPNGTFPGIYDTKVWVASLGVTWSLPSK